jgi:ribosomal protein L23
VNKAIYSQHLKPYLLKHKMKEVGDIVESIKFAVCSECGDNALLKNLYELLEIKYHKGALRDSRHIYDLHLYTHYLRIKGYTIKLNKELEKELTAFCRERNESRESLNRVVFEVHAEAKGKAKSKHVSECLKTNKSYLSEYPATKRSVFESNFRYKLLHLKLDELKIYEKPIFCCFELDFCLRKQTTNELMNVEIEGMQYVFTSGRMTRNKEIRDEILTHYGFKVTHVDYNTFKAKDRVTEDVVLMNKRFLENK